jgi:hypothetical protein
LRQGKQPRRSGPLGLPLLWRQLWAPLALVVLLLVSGVIIVPQQALPGDPLYGLKRTVEGVSLSLAPGETARERLQARFHEERLNEVARLLLAGREAEVAFTGIIELLAVDVWVISGFPVTVLPDTAVSGDAMAGAAVYVVGRVGQGRLVASSITVLSSPERPLPPPELNPTLPATFTPVPTTTPSATPSATTTPASTTTTATATATGTATATATTTMTAPATAVPSPTPAATVTPTVPPDFNDNQNDNSNSNDNDNDDDDDNSNSNSNDDDNSNSNSNDDNSNSNDDDDDDDDDDSR